MNLVDQLFSPLFTKVVFYLKDLVRFVLAPGDYLRRVAHEPDLETTRRLVFYAVGFAILEIAAFSLAFRTSEHPGVYTVLGIATFETVLGLPFAPCFYLVGKYLGVDRPLKTTLVYCLTFKFVYFTPLVILYALFLTTEDYFFAMTRGYGAYAQLLAYVLIFPISLSGGLRKRVMATGVSLGVACVTFVLMDMALGSFETKTSDLGKFALLYDPIGAEVDRLDIDLEFLESSDSELRRWEASVDSILGTAKTSVAATAMLLGRVKTDWSSLREVLQPTLYKRRLSVQEQRSKVIFATSGELLRLAAAEVDQGEALLVAADRFTRTPSLAALLRLKQMENNVMEAEIRRLETVVSYVEVRNRLRLRGLLIDERWPPTPSKK